MFPLSVYAQERSVEKKKYGAQSAVKSISKSLEEEQPDDSVAINYVNAGKALALQGDYTRAESYFNNARELFVKTKNTEQTAMVLRELAKTQEAQRKFNEASSNFNNAGKLTHNLQFQELNLNDYKRLQNLASPLNQSVYIERNIKLLDETNKKEEKAVAFQQMANVNIEMNNNKEAISNLQQALVEVEDKPLQVAKVQREIANVYVADKQYDKATESLRQAYDLAVREGHTLDAKKSLELLVSQYRKEKRSAQALELYNDFMTRLEPMIKADSTLIDERFFEVHEARIEQLEKERVLKDELILKQDVINSILQVSVVLILIFLFFSIKAWYSIKQRNKRIALQSLRREMNPHFIFNSLNSVNQFIAQNKELEANRYLSSYSRLMRNMMEHSNKDFTTLSTELEQLKEYLDLEHMRFHDKFEYKIIIDESLDTDRLYVPNMLIQPQLENAIWHGLRYREKDGLLILRINPEKERLCVTIEDNGIGLQQSKELKTSHQKKHQSRGLTNSRERINLLNSLYRCHISMDITEKVGDETGVVVRFCFPLKHSH